MPMVPTYNSNIPTVADSGGVSGGTAQARMPDLNPQTTLSRAEQTAHNAVGMMLKLTEAQHQMETKAATDDAEVQAMELINRELLHPQTGYFTQRGKNAMAGYQPTMDRIKQGLNKITEGMAPQVQQAVKAKMDDRYVAAMGRATQFRFEQTQKYMVESADNNLKVLADDYALHFDDPEYRSRTLSSAWQKVQELGAMMGWDQEQIKRQAQAQFDLMESKRYNQWAQTDPVGALADFQQNKSGISPDIAGKIQHQLFQQSKGLLANGMAEAGGVAVSQAKAGGKVVMPDLGDWKPDERTMKTLGWRQNNPLSVEQTKERWQGQVDGDDSRFCRFETPQAGIRAGAKLLRTYGSKYGIDTIRKVISRYTDPKTDDQAGYIAHVCAWMGVKPDEKIDLQDKKTVRLLVGAMIRQEMGYGKDPYPSDIVDAGVDAAFGAPLESPGKTETAGQPQSAAGGPRLGKWGIDVDAPTGNPVVDRLPPDQKLLVLQSVVSQRKAMDAQERSQFKVQMDNSLETFANTGKDENALTRDMFVERFGRGEGDELYDKYKLQADVNASIYNFRTMDADGIQRILAAVKPVPGTPDYATRSTAYKAVQKAALSTMEARQKDPVGSLIALGVNGVKALDFSKPADIGEQLRIRNESLQDNARFLGVPVQHLMTKQEATAFTQVLDTLPIDQRAAVLHSIADKSGQEIIPRLADQLKDGNSSYALAMSGINEFPDGGSVSVGEKYLRGKDFIKSKIVKLDSAAEVGLQAQLGKILEADGEVEGVFPDGSIRDKTVEMAIGVWGYRAGMNQGRSAEDAMTEAVGAVVKHNGKKVIVPRGVRPGSTFLKDFRDAVRIYANTVVKKEKDNFYAGTEKVTPSQLAEELPKLKLQTWGSSPDGGVQYKVIRNGRFLTRRSADGKTNEDLVITINKGLLE